MALLNNNINSLGIFSLHQTCSKTKMRIFNSSAPSFRQRKVLSIFQTVRFSLFKSHQNKRKLSKDGSTAKFNAIAKGKQPLTTNKVKAVVQAVAKAVVKANNYQSKRKKIRDFKASAANAVNVKLAEGKQPLTTDKI